MTEFLESFATRQLLPPWEARDVDISCFVVALEPGTIQNYLDKFFNFGGEDRAPFYFKEHHEFDFGVLVFQQFAKIGSSNKANMAAAGVDYESWDHLSYNQAFVAVPIIRYSITADNLLVDPQLYWTQPVVISDSATVVFGSREIVGIDMIQGRIEVADGALPGSLHIDTWINGFARFSPQTKESELPFVHVETGARFEGDGMPTATQSMLAKLLMARLEVGGNAQPLGSQKLVTLKQFRDSFDLQRATYQAIVSSSSTIVGDMRNLRHFEPQSVEIEFIWSDSASEILSSFLHLGTFEPPADDPLKHGREWNMAYKKLPTQMCFRFTADLRFDAFETLHTFGQRD